MCIAACRRKLRDTWSTVAHQFQKSPAIDYYAQPVDNTLWCHVAGGTRSGTRPFQSPVLLRETLYQIVSVTKQLSSDSFRGNYLKRNYLRVIKHTKAKAEAYSTCIVPQATYCSCSNAVHVRQWTYSQIGRSISAVEVLYNSALYISHRHWHKNADCNKSTTYRHTKTHPNRQRWTAYQDDCGQRPFEFLQLTELADHQRRWRHQPLTSSHHLHPPANTRRSLHRLHKTNEQITKVSWEKFLNITFWGEQWSETVTSWRRKTVHNWIRQNKTPENKASLV